MREQQGQARRNEGTNVRTSDRQVRQMHARPSFDTNRSPIVSKRPSYTRRTTSLATTSLLQ